jgi:hypothetical protein
MIRTREGDSEFWSQLKNSKSTYPLKGTLGQPHQPAAAALLLGSVAIAEGPEGGGLGGAGKSGSERIEFGDRPFWQADSGTDGPVT